MTQTKNRRSRPRQCVQFKRVQSLVSPQNIATLRSEAKRYGQSMSEVVNDAVIVFCSLMRGEPLFGSGGKRSLQLRKKGR